MGWKNFFYYPMFGLYFYYLSSQVKSKDCIVLQKPDKSWGEFLRGSKKLTLVDIFIDLVSKVTIPTRI